MGKYRIVFMGTPNSVAPILEKIGAQGHDVVAIYTAQEKGQTSRSGSRGSTIRDLANLKGIPLYEPETLRSPNEINLFRELAADAIILAAYGKILPKELLEIPLRGCLNIHPSLLPRHRGATPVAETILGGDERAGISIFLMDEGVDTGPILAQQEMELAGNETTGALTTKLFALGAELLGQVLTQYLEGTLLPRKQPTSGITVTRRLAKEDGLLNWNKPGVQLEREIRGYNPWPGSSTQWKGKRLQIIEAGLVESTENHDSASLPVGSIVKMSNRPLTAAAVVAGGWLVLKKVKLEGKAEMRIADFLNGHPAFLSSRLGNW